MQTLAQYGLTILDVKSEILDLTVDDYYKGPKQDYDLNRPGDIWEFKKDIDGNKFYVKVKIVEKKLRQQLSQKKKFIMYAVNQ